MEQEREKKPTNIFDNDDLDDAIANADETGLVRSERLITEEELLKGTEEPD
jgi:hypothetical protein